MYSEINMLKIWEDCHHLVLVAECCDEGHNVRTTCEVV